MSVFGEQVDWNSWLDHNRERWGSHLGWFDIRVGDYDKAISILKKRLEERQTSLRLHYSNPDDPYGVKKSIEKGLIKEKDLDWALEKHIEAKNRTCEDIKKFTHLIELLSIPDTEYFEKVFAENEAKTREYLSNPRKYKQKGGY